MNRCTQLDEILYEHVARQPLKPYWISRLFFREYTKVHEIVFTERGKNRRS